MMDDDEDLEIIVKTMQPRKHDRWSVIVLMGSFLTEISRVVHEHIEASTDALQEHRWHKIEEERFYEVVRDGNAG
jgi:hypothetical protein